MCSDVLQVVDTLPSEIKHIIHNFKRHIEIMECLRNIHLIRKSHFETNCGYTLYIDSSSFDLESVCNVKNLCLDTKIAFFAFNISTKQYIYLKTKSLFADNILFFEKNIQQLTYSRHFL